MHGLQIRLRKVKSQRIQNTADDRATAGTVFGFAGADRATILSRAAKRSFAFVVRAGDFRMNHIRKQFVVAKQTKDLMRQIIEIFSTSSAGVRLSQKRFAVQS